MVSAERASLSLCPHVHLCRAGLCGPAWINSVYPSTHFFWKPLTFLFSLLSFLLSFPFPSPLSLPPSLITPSSSLLLPSFFHVCIPYMRAHICVLGETKSLCWESSLLTPYCIFWGKVSPLSSDFADLANLACQLALGIPGLSPKYYVLGRLPYPSSIYRVMGIPCATSAVKQSSLLTS